MDWSVLQPDPDLGTPLYIQLCQSLTEQITNGALAPGDQLPSERKLAKLFSLSRTTAINTYKELEARGLVRSYTGRGTFVSGRPERLGPAFAWRGKVTPSVQRHLDTNMRSLVKLSPPGQISFAGGRPALDCFPTQAYLAASEKVLTGRAAEVLNFLPTEGHPVLREIIAQREQVSPRQVLIVTGAQQALDLISRCLIYPQDSIVMDWPGFIGAIQTFRLAGAVLTGWDISKADLYELEDSFLKRRPKLLYLNPSFQNPTGQTLSLAKRQAVIELARSYRVPIVEDEAYRDLFFHTPPPPTLFNLEGSGLVLHLRSFSKTFAPGMRLGYVLADEAIIDQLSLIKAQSDLFNSGLSQLIIAELLDNGVFDTYTAQLRQQHLERACTMTKALHMNFPRNSLHWQQPKGGLYLWATLEQGDNQQLISEAAKHDVSFAPGSSFFWDGSGKHSLRLCYAGTTPAEISEGVQRLARVHSSVT